MSYPLALPGNFSTVEIGYPEQHDDVLEVQRLEGFLSRWRPWLTWYDQYYAGEQALQFMAPALVKELGERITNVVINWPRLGADAYENRLDLEGFRYAGDDDRDQKLWDVWQANNCDEQSQQAHLESLVLSRSYVIVGAGDDEGDPPIISVESPFQVYAARDPRTRRVSSAVKRWAEDDGTQQAVLYRPDRTVSLTWPRSGKGGWQIRDIDRHGLGRVPVVPLVNRPRMLRPDGLSEFHDVLPVADAANKMATDMMVSGEYHAMPRRWIFGMDPEDFVDAGGNQKSTWSAIAGRLWATRKTKGEDGGEMKAGQFTEADLAVFHNTIRVLAQLASQLLALPPHYMSFTTDNPASADAIRSSETQLVKRVERKHTFLGGAWEDVMRLALRIETGEWDDKARSLETMWRDPSTPTIAQKADAALKLFSARDGQGRAIVPLEQTREDMGYTPEQRRRMAEMDERDALDPITRALMPPPASPIPLVTGDAAEGG